MVLYEIDPIPIPDSDIDNSTTCASPTPPSTVVGDSPNNYTTESKPITATSSIPWPGSTFIIRSVPSGKVLTLHSGRVLLSSPGSRGSIHWKCVDNKGWLGFQNVVSVKFLGYNIKGRLVCDVGRQQEWENFCASARPEGGFVLLMTHWERLWRVGSFWEEGEERLVKVREEDSEKMGVAWEFVKV